MIKYCAYEILFSSVSYISDNVVSMSAYKYMVKYY